MKESIRDSKRWMEEWLSQYWATDIECPLPNEFIEERYGAEAIERFASDDINDLFNLAAVRAGWDKDWSDDFQGYHDEHEILFLNALAIIATGGENAAR